MGFAQTASVGRNLTMEYVRRVDASPREDFCERSSRNLVDDKGVFIANFFITRRLGKTTFVLILHPFWLRVGTFLDLWGSLGAKVGPSIDFRTILGCFWGGFGRPWGPFGLPWGTEWRPERPKKREKYRTV